MSAPVIVIIIFAAVFIIGGPIVGSYANRVSHNAEKSEKKK